VNHEGLHVIGTVDAVYKTFEKRSKAGETYGGDWRVQIETIENMAEGSRKGQFDLRTDDPVPFQKLQGKKISLPVSTYAPAKGTVIFVVAGNPFPLGSGA